MNPRYAEYLTWFGNVSVLIPLSLGLALWIALRISRRMAVLWLATVGGVGVLIALTKIWMSACHVRAWNVHSPSGHAGFSSIAYGGLAVVMTATTSARQRAVIAVLTLLWVVGIASTRVVVHAHTPQEVIAGLACGALGVLIFAGLYRADVRPPLRWMVPAVMLLAAIALYPPAHFSLEPLLRELGRWSAARAPICGAVTVSGGSP